MQTLKMENKILNIFTLNFPLILSELHITKVVKLLAC